LGLRLAFPWRSPAGTACLTHKTVAVAPLARAFAVGPSEVSGGPTSSHDDDGALIETSHSTRDHLHIFDGECIFSRQSSLFLLYLIMAEAFYWSSSFIGPLHAESSLAAGTRALAERLRGTASFMLLADLAGRPSPLGFCNNCVLSTLCLSSSIRQESTIFQTADSLSSM